MLNYLNLYVTVTLWMLRVVLCCGKRMVFHVKGTVWELCGAETSNFKSFIIEC